MANGRPQSVRTWPYKVNKAGRPMGLQRGRALDRGRRGRVTWRAGAGLGSTGKGELRVVFTAPHAPLPGDVAGWACGARTGLERDPGWGGGERSGSVTPALSDLGRVPRAPWAPVSSVGQPFFGPFLLPCPDPARVTAESTSEKRCLGRERRGRGLGSCVKNP